MEEINFNIRDFKDTEIAEINTYVSTQVPQSKLPQMFIISEEPLKKAKIFIIIYRILQGARDFVELDSTRNKLINILKKYESIYIKLYSLELRLEGDINFGKHLTKIKILDIIEKNNININKLINSFLVFAEKQVLTSTEKVAGINLDKEEGKDIYNKLISKI